MVVVFGTGLVVVVVLGWRVVLFFSFGVVGGELPVVGHGRSGRWGRQQKEEEEEKTLDFVVLVARQWRLIGRGPSELCRCHATPCLPVLPSKGPPFPN